MKTKRILLVAAVLLAIIGWQTQYFSKNVTDYPEEIPYTIFTNWCYGKYHDVCDPGIVRKQEIYPGTNGDDVKRDEWWGWFSILNWHFYAEASEYIKIE